MTCAFSVQSTSAYGLKVVLKGSSVVVTKVGDVNQERTVSGTDRKNILTFRHPVISKWVSIKTGRQTDLS